MPALVAIAVVIAIVAIVVTVIVVTVIVVTVIVAIVVSVTRFQYYANVVYSSITEIHHPAF